MTDRRFERYALTAGAAATLFAAGEAGAGIVSSTSVVPVNDASTTLFTFNGQDAVAKNTSFTRFPDAYNSKWYRHASVEMSGPTTGGFHMAFFTANPGGTINTNPNTGSNEQALRIGKVKADSILKVSTGNLGLGTDNLIGFEISDGSSQNFYGWIEYTLQLDGAANERNRFLFTINAWAYNDVANQGIISGQNTAAGSNAVPGLGGLAALAIGAAGVRSRRQRIA